ncbi:hypothetical protein [Aquicella lusitana]|uniref:Uncharacterized protein n=2 Tax=Aquicella lusitana TaxID=254246 RepID=A0A370H0U6_9COXI|nr:hypothetical protein [Aquicella lusitana]RDI48594.1 hypothetical protein C8D86_10221 [Aquicella lusitana]VVC74029.1 hypothetical protein AQULUS_17920 [Aquicella lusitana]
MDLYDLCSGKKNVEYQDLADKVLAIFKHILNVESADEVGEKLARRKIMRRFDPSYIPWARPKTVSGAFIDPYPMVKQATQNNESEQTIFDAVQNFYKRINDSDDLLNINYMQECSDDKSTIEIKSFDYQELEQFRVYPYQGKLIKMLMEGSGDNQHLSFDFFESTKLVMKGYYPALKQKWDLKNRGIYLIHADGSFFAGSSIHPQRVSLLDLFFRGQQPIIHPSYRGCLKQDSKDKNYPNLAPYMAGEIGDAVKGVLGEIDAASGHFKPSYQQARCSVQFLRDMGLAHNLTRVTFYDREGVFTHLHTTENEKMLFDYALENGNSDIKKLMDIIIKYNKKDYIEEVKQTLLKTFRDEAKPVYHAYQWQDEINQFYARWMSDSKVYGSTPSRVTLELNRAVEKLSFYAIISDPDNALSYLQRALDAVESWKKFHDKGSGGSSSLREKAVKKLEKDLRKQVFNFELIKLCKLSKSKNKIVMQLLKGEINQDEFIQAVREEKAGDMPKKPLFFSSPSLEHDDFPFHMIAKYAENFSELAGSISAHLKAFEAKMLLTKEQVSFY